jgi:hypothetical protein
MIRAVDVYLRLRRTAGFKLESAEYLLRSFAHFATTRGEQFIRAQTAIDWAALGPSLAQRDARLKAIKPTGGPSNGGLDNNEWTAVVARDGTVCAVTFSGSKPQDQWPASRGIAAEKTNTANGVSLKQFAFSLPISTRVRSRRRLCSAWRQATPVVPDVLHSGDPSQFGSEADPMIGKHLGGVIGFGGGLALFLYVLNRHLPREEGYFTFSYSPIRDDDGSIGGIFLRLQRNHRPRPR